MSLHVTKGFRKSRITSETIFVNPILFLDDQSADHRERVTGPGTHSGKQQSQDWNTSVPVSGVF